MNMQKIIYAFFLITMMYGCGGGSDGPASSTLTGVFIDARAIGLSYSTLTLSGKTNTNGEFLYKTGETVTFSIGDIVLGSATGSSVITPVELVPGATDATHPAVINISRLLQTVDDSGVPGYINIPDVAHVNATGVSINFDQPTTDFQIDTDLGSYLSSGGTSNITLVDAEVAQAHLEDSLSGLANASELNGRWSMEFVTGANNCGDNPSGISYVYSNITQTGSNVSATFEVYNMDTHILEPIPNVVMSGVVVGNIWTLNSFSFPDEGGTTVVNSTTLTIADDGNSFIGAKPWTWSSPDEGSCSGTGTIRGYRSDG